MSSTQFELINRPRRLNSLRKYSREISPRPVEIFIKLNGNYPRSSAEERWWIATGIGIALEKCNIVSPDDFPRATEKFNEPQKPVRFEQTQQKKQRRWRRMREETSSGRNILIKAYFYDNDFSSRRGPPVFRSSKTSRRLFGR